MSSVIIPPPLIEPVTLVVETINKAKTPFSSGVMGRREIVNQVSRDQFTVEAQVVFGNQDQISQNTQLGSDEKAKGYAVFRRQDFKDMGRSIKRGDRIIKIADQDLTQILYFVHSVGDLASHFSSAGFSYVRIFFTDRDPVG